MIAITGATGQLGRLVLEALQSKGQAGIRALARSPEKARDLESAAVSVVEADYDRPETLVPALSGVERLLLISGSEVGKRSAQHTAVIEAAKVAGVKFIAYTSILNADSSPMLLADEHKVTEKLLALSGIPHALLRNGWYMENYAGTIAGALASGTVTAASGEGRVSPAARKDYAEAAASVIRGSDLSTRTYKLAGSSSFTMSELAAELSAQTGRDITFTNITEEENVERLKGFGLPEALAVVLGNTDVGAEQGALYGKADALEGLIGHKTLQLKDYIADFLKQQG